MRKPQIRPSEETMAGDPVDNLMLELLDRYPHLRGPSDAMHREGAAPNQFARDALSAFRQRFQA